jgi:F0F1-type ATP synthase membrane subunit c/vacuolar-type H+-ATPase subunit K
VENKPNEKMNPLRTTKIIIGAFAVSVLVYVGMTFEMTPPGQAGEVLKFLPWVFLGIAAALFLTGPWLENLVVRSAAKSPAVSSPMMQGAIVSAAAGESMAIFGLIIWLLTANRNWDFVFSALALGYLFLLFGRLEDLEKLGKGDA